VLSLFLLCAQKWQWYKRLVLKKGKVKTKNSQVCLIAERCKGCGFCIEFCPKHILHESTKTNKKGNHIIEINDRDNCTGCELCSMVCPEFAIFVITTPSE